MTSYAKVKVEGDVYNYDTDDDIAQTETGVTEESATRANAAAVVEEGMATLDEVETEGDTRSGTNVTEDINDA